jgi:hypothetical protein
MIWYLEKQKTVKSQFSILIGQGRFKYFYYVIDLELELMGILFTAF